VKNAAAHAKKLLSVLKSLKKKVELPDKDTCPIEVLSIAVLAWESTTDKATAMLTRLIEGTVDWNDLRVCMPEEIVAMSGDKSPEALERATRLKMVLRDVYLRHHEVTLAPEFIGRKREIKASISGLDGLTSYAASRVLTVAFDVPQVPVDSQVRELLISKGAAHEDATEDDVAALLNKSVKVDHVADVHAKLQAWVDAQHDKLQIARRKAEQAELRAAKKRRDKSKADRAKRQVERAKALIAAKKAAEEKAIQRAIRKAEAEAKAEAAAIAKEEALKAKQKAAKKAARQKASKKKVTKKTVAKRTPTKKKASKKKVAKRTPTKKKASKKKITKRTAAKKKGAKKKATKKKVAKRTATKKKVAKKKTATRKKTSRR
jgi:hypothetical protein